MPPLPLLFASDMFKPAQVLRDRYELQTLLGKGPGRQTWRALDQGHNPPVPVILKLLAFNDERSWSEIKLFEREIQVLQTLDHPALPHYRDSFSIQDPLLWFGLVQDEIPGQSLADWLTANHPSTDHPTLELEQQLRHWATELLIILVDLHGQAPPILHRDIKPSNLLWGDDGRLYLIDLGAAQHYQANPSLGTSFTVVGTYGYTPLEQFGGRAVPASDLYALGATLVHLLTGIAPADLPLQNLRLQFYDAVPTHLGPISPAFLDWLQQLLAPDVEQRPASALAALATLQGLPTLRELPASSPSILSNQSSVALPCGTPLVSEQPLRSSTQSTTTTPRSPTLAPPEARLRLRRSPDRLLIELPSGDLGYSIALLGCSLICWSLLNHSGLLLFGLLLTLAGIAWASPRHLRWERQGQELLMSQGKQIGRYWLRLGGQHRLRFPPTLSQNLPPAFAPLRASTRSITAQQPDTSTGRAALNRPFILRGKSKGFNLRNTAEAIWWSLRSNHRFLIISTATAEISIATNLHWNEITWLINQIYAWSEEVYLHPSKRKPHTLQRL